VLERAKTVRALDRSATAIGESELDSVPQVSREFSNGNLGHMTGKVSAN
jgi:hypothetical protein